LGRAAVILISQDLVCSYDGLPQQRWYYSE
jgi:hypothetical protein